MPPDMRICFIGDSFVNGTHDETCLGWTGRVCAQASAHGIDLTLYNLGIRRDTSYDILARWRVEAARRLTDACDGRLVFSFGVNDCVWENGRPRIAHSDSMANARTILKDASSWKPTLMIGPPPIVLPEHGPIAERIGAVSQGLTEICIALGIPFIDLFDRLRGDAAWQADMDAGDGVHPTSAGYIRLAGIIQACPEWDAWLREEGPNPRI